MPTDETLSAFLDGELPPADMDAVREQLRQQPELAARLAELSLVDKLVRAQASRIDSVPMPQSVLALLGAEATAQQSRANVVAFPSQRVRRWGVPLALAASLMVAFGVWRSLPTETLPYVMALEAVPSGEQVTIKQGTFIANFSYRDHDNNFCRQYLWREGARSTDNIACRHGDEWVIKHSAQSVAGDGASYVPATRSSELDKLLDADMQGQALDAAAERELLGKQWAQ